MYGTVRHYTDCAAGFLVQSELDFLGRLLGKPAKPFVAVVGGAKVSDKIGVIRSLIGRCDTVLVGGAMAYTLLVSQGHEVGNSRVEPDKLDLAREILDLAASRRTRLLLPSDHIVAASIDAAKGKTTRGVDIPAGQSGFDIGPKTRAVFTDRLKSAGTVFWNGPVGVFEREPFREGTMAIARAIADSAAVSVVGGGDSAAAVRLAGLGDQIDHVSTGGGASLRFVEGGPLPGLEALRAGHRFEEE
jgi:phosphoglycerate kinase